MRITATGDTIHVAFEASKLIAVMWPAPTTVRPGLWCVGAVTEGMMIWSMTWEPHVATVGMVNIGFAWEETFKTRMEPFPVHYICPSDVRRFIEAWNDTIHPFVRPLDRRITVQYTRTDW